jgi:predicted nicotinamide N-methyase
MSPLSVAGYPTRRLAVELGGLQLQLLAVKDLETYVDAEALLRDADAPEPPYWAHLWAGSRALARLVATELECAGRRVLDVGCGVGLAGIVAARRGARVVMLDLAPQALHFAHANACLNGCEVFALRTDLRRPGLRGRFDHVLAADVTYDPVLQASLAALLAAHLASGGRAWCAESVRTADCGLAIACAARGLRVDERSLCEFDEGRDVRVRLSEVYAPH